GARLLAAEWALDDRDALRALSLLEALPPGVARRTQALQLKLQAARLDGRPQEALRTARLLVKHQVISPAAATSLMRSLAFESIEAARDDSQLQRLWLEFDAADRRDPFVVAKAASRVADLGAPEHGRGWLRPFWDDLKSFTPEERMVLSNALVACIQGIPADWLPRLDACTQAFPREAAVAHAVGVALAHWRLWGKAHPLLVQAAQDPSCDERTRRQAWLSLAKIAEQEGQDARVLECYREAAILGM
ncbi:MAG: heme biosynthesis protein HemY, partial [Burkholderiales bacterium]